MSSDMAWRTSSYSGGESGACVEIAIAGRRFVRDTKNRDGGSLNWPEASFNAFLGKLKNGELSG